MCRHGQGVNMPVVAGNRRPALAASVVMVTVRTGSGRGDGTLPNLGLKSTGNGLMYAPRNPLASAMRSVNVESIHQNSVTSIIFNQLAIFKIKWSLYALSEIYKAQITTSVDNYVLSAHIPMTDHQFRKNCVFNNSLPVLFKRFWKTCP